MSTPDGGPAFPFVLMNPDGTGKYCEGMSERTYIAVHANEQDVRIYEYEDYNGTMMRIRTRVEARYAFADAMLAAR